MTLKSLLNVQLDHFSINLASISKYRNIIPDWVKFENIDTRTTSDDFSLRHIHLFNSSIPIICKPID